MGFINGIFQFLQSCDIMILFWKGRWARDLVRQFMKFAAVGISSSVVNFLVFNGVLWLLRRLDLFPQWDYLLALLIGFIFSVLWVFCLSRRFVFNSPEERNVPWYSALTKMYITYALTGVGLGTLLSVIWVSFLGIPKEFVPVLNDLSAFPVNYMLNKFWSFRKTARN